MVQSWNTSSNRYLTTINMVLSLKDEGYFLLFHRLQVLALVLEMAIASGLGLLTGKTTEKAWDQPCLCQNHSFNHHSSRASSDIPRQLPLFLKSTVINLGPSFSSWILVILSLSLWTRPKQVQILWNPSNEKGSWHKFPSLSKKIFAINICWERQKWFSPA